MGVPVLWQDGPVVQFSHFLVSNVQSKFYRLDLVFFLNSKDQQKVLRFSLYIVTLAGCDEMKTRREEEGGGKPPIKKRATHPTKKQNYAPENLSEHGQVVRK